MDIEERTRGSGKTYDFNEGHNRRRPAQYWFQSPPEGLTLFLVLYTMACRWSQCLGCNLPSMVSKNYVPFGDIMAQVDYLFGKVLSKKRKKDLRKIILSNNGSILDEATFSTSALIYFVAKMNLHCPGITALSIETRPEYIDWEELEVLSRALKEGPTPTDLEIAIGFEAYNDTIRNEYFHKGMSLEKFEEMVGKISRYNFKLKTYFMQKPVPEISEDEGKEDIVNAIDYLDIIARKYSVEINMHLNPTYVAGGTELERAFIEGRYAPPALESVRRAVLHGENRAVSIYIGLNDEGLAVPGGGFIRKGDEALLAKMEEFNRTKDYSLLK